MRIFAIALAGIAAALLASASASAQPVPEEQRDLAWCSAVLRLEGEYWTSPQMAEAYERAAVAVDVLASRVPGAIGEAAFGELVAAEQDRAAELVVSAWDHFLDELDRCEAIAGAELFPDWFEYLAQDIGIELWCSAVFLTEASYWLAQGNEALDGFWGEAALNLEDRALVLAGQGGHEEHALYRALNGYDRRAERQAEDRDAFGATLADCEGRFAGFIPAETPPGIPARP